MTPNEFYSSKLSDRKVYEDRAKEIAKVTLPYVIRDSSASKTTEYETNPAQAFGARLVNVLKSKMGMSLLPPSVSSFRYVANPEEMFALSQGNPANVQKINQAISSATIRVNEEIELQQIRNSMFEFIVQLICVGSVVIEKVKGKGIRLHTLMSFVADLNSQGEPMTIGMYEVLNRQNIPPDYVVTEEKEEYDLYTMYRKENDSDKWIMTQEIDGQLLANEQTFKDIDALPVRYLGWTWNTGDTYHRPYAEDYLPDLQQLNKYAQLLTDGSLVAAKTLLFVNERGGRTRKDEVAESLNGDVIDGSAEDVTALQLGKNYDFQTPMEREANLKKELSAAFLLNESATRDAERVTAMEVRFMAQELETSAVSGIFSILSKDWSKWIIEKIQAEVGVNFDAIGVDILTGLDALGRTQESQKLDAYVQRMMALEMGQYLNKAELAMRYAMLDGIETRDLLKTEEQVAKEQQEAMAAQALQAGDEAAMTAAGQQVGGQPQEV